MGLIMSDGLFGIVVVIVDGERVVVVMHDRRRTRVPNLVRAAVIEGLSITVSSAEKHPSNRSFCDNFEIILLSNRSSTLLVSLEGVGVKGGGRATLTENFDVITFGLGRQGRGP